MQATYIYIAILIISGFFLFLIFRRETYRSGIQRIDETHRKLRENQQRAKQEIDTASDINRRSGELNRETGKINSELKELNTDSRRHIDAAKAILNRAKERTDSKEF